MKTEWDKWKEEEKDVEQDLQISEEVNLEKKLIGKEKTSYARKTVGMFFLGILSIGCLAASFVYPVFGLVASPLLVLTTIILFIASVITIFSLTASLNKHKQKIKRKENSLADMEIRNPYNDYRLRSEMSLEYNEETILDHPFIDRYSSPVPTISITNSEGKTHEKNIFKSTIT